MPSAFIIINCDLGSEEAVLKEIVQLDGVKEVKRVSGIYELVVEVESDSAEALKELIKGKIRSIPRVRSTVSLLVTKS